MTKCIPNKRIKQNMSIAMRTAAMTFARAIAIIIAITSYWHSALVYAQTGINDSNQVIGAVRGTPNPLVQQLNHYDRASLVIWHTKYKQPLVQFQAELPQSPASTMKLVTSAVALEQLGKSHQWSTKMYASQPIKNRTLTGDVWLQGSGDPKMMPELWTQTLQKLREKVDVLENVRWNFIPTFAKPADTAVQDDTEDNPIYAVQPSAYSFAYKTFSLMLDPNAPSNLGGWKVPQPLTPLYGISIINQLKLTNDACPAGKAWAQNVHHQLLDLDHSNINNSHLNEAKANTPFQNLKKQQLILTGSYPRNCGSKLYHANILEDEPFFLRATLGIWQQLGGAVKQSAQYQLMPNHSAMGDAFLNAKNNQMLLLAHQSPSLAQIIYDQNKFSNNLIARLVFLQIGLNAVKLENAGKNMAPPLAQKNLSIPVFQKQLYTKL